MPEPGHANHKRSDDMSEVRKNRVSLWRLFILNSASVVGRKEGPLENILMWWLEMMTIWMWVMGGSRKYLCRRKQQPWHWENLAYAGRNPLCFCRRPVGSDYSNILWLRLEIPLFAWVAEPAALRQGGHLEQCAWRQDLRKMSWRLHPSHFASGETVPISISGITTGKIVDYGDLIAGYDIGTIHSDWHREQLFRLRNRNFWCKKNRIRMLVGSGCGCECFCLSAYYLQKRLFQRNGKANS